MERKEPEAKVGRVLVIMADNHLGNFVVASPLIAGLARTLGEQLAGVVIDVRLLPLATRVPGLQRARFVLYRDRTTRGLARRALGYLALVRELRSLRPACSLDLESNQAGALIGWLAMVPRRVGEDTGRQGWTYNDAVPGLNAGHRYDRYARIAAHVGLNIEPRPPRLSPTTEDQDGWAQFRTRTGIAPNEAYACLHVGGGRDAKCWPEDRFAALTFELAGRGLRSVLVGGRADRSRAGRVLAHAESRTVSAVDEVGLGALLAGFAGAAVFVGNDSGPAHLAAAVGAPVVVLFGPTDPRIWAPLTSATSVVRGATLLTGPDAGVWCDDPRTMDSIELHQVCDAVDRGRR
jgi:heptosyltransferase-3